MPRRPSYPRALTAVAWLAATVLLIGVLGLATPAGAEATQAGNWKAEPDGPIEVTITAITPGSVPSRGPVVVRGTVTNVDEGTWENVGVYPFVSGSPITTVGDLEESVDVANADVAVPVGERILVPGTFTTIDRIDPGASVSFELTIPRPVLRAEILRQSPVGAVQEGVYWFGVHALGTGPEGYDDFADGRARTFLPLVSRRTAAAGEPVEATLVVPVRARVFRNPDGRIANVSGWSGLLAADGRLGRLLSLGTAAGGLTLSWLVDPAVIDAVRQLAAGNPARDLGPTDGEGEDEGEDEGEEGASESPSPSGSPSPSATSAPEPDADTETAISLATRWLDGMQQVLASDDVLALPYGDIDLAAVARQEPGLYETARARSEAVFEELGIAATPVNAPGGGLVDAATLRLVEPQVPTLVSDQAVQGGADPVTGAAGPVVASAAGWRLVLSSSAAASGGPAPGDPLAGVPLRQRLLAEAAVRLLDPDRPPLVVTLPDRWRADPELFDDLSEPWLRLTGLTEATAGSLGPTVDPATLHYPEDARAASIGMGDVAAADALIRSGRTLQRVLTRNDRVAEEVTDEALATLGHLARGAPTDPAVASREWILDQLGSIEVQAPAAVTLSSSNGRFSATVLNGLPEPVTVQIRPLTSEGITIGVPTDVEVAGDGRATVVLTADAAREGVHNVALRITDTEGVRLGGSTIVPIRAAQVSGIIWLFLGVGAALLFGAIGVRLFRRIRAARRQRTAEPAEPAEQAADDRPVGPPAVTGAP